ASLDIQEVERRAMTRSQGLVLLFAIALVLPARMASQTGDPANFVGSAVCKTCHPAIWGRWSKTRMANVLNDPKVKPEVILPDFPNPHPVLPFGIADFAWFYGGKLKQLYFRKPGDAFFPLPAGTAPAEATAGRAPFHVRWTRQMPNLVFFAGIRR